MPQVLSVCQGGLGNDLDFKDMSGKSFQRGQFFKVMMRGTNWEGADLTDARRALSAAQPPWPSQPLCRQLGCPLYGVTRTGGASVPVEKAVEGLHFPRRSPQATAVCVMADKGAWGAVYLGASVRMQISRMPI